MYELGGARLVLDFHNEEDGQELYELRNMIGNLWENRIDTEWVEPQCFACLLRRLTKLKLIT